ncbi:MAG: alpha/beta hydrolase fold protein [Clostridia bacterium]|jgi:pimeloyl-ACP methyl ester carboxylesterase|nr:alpha/beta hydrolase fold protein [Clostridia bacterium]
MIQEFEIKYISLSNGERLAYREIGRGKNVLLLIHGNMSSGLHFLPIIERMPEDFKAFAVDLRGFGESSYNNSFDSLKDLSEDIYEFVSLLGLKDFTMIGWSTGGGICLQLEADHSGFANKIALIESVGYTGYPLRKKNAAGQMLEGTVYESKAEMALDAVQVAPVLTAIEKKDFAFMNWLWDVAIYTNKKPEPEYNNLYINETLKQKNLVDIDWSLANFNMSHNHNGYISGSGLIDNIEIPVLSFWSDKDLVVQEDAVKATVEAIGNNAELIILKDSGHSPLVDCPDLLAQKLFDFVRKV